MFYSVDLHFPRMHQLASDPQDGELFRLNGCDPFHLKSQLLRIREEIDKQIANVEWDLNYIKRTWNPDNEESSLCDDGCVLNRPGCQCDYQPGRARGSAA